MHDSTNACINFFGGEKFIFPIHDYFNIFFISGSMEKGIGEGKWQFIDLPLIQVRIKFDANMELAHLYSKMGDYENAEACYKKLDMELDNKKEKLTDNGYAQL